MIKLNYKYRLYDIRKYPYKYVGIRNIYRDKLGNTYILQNNNYIPASMLRDKKGSYFITNYSKAYSIKRKK